MKDVNNQTILQFKMVKYQERSFNPPKKKTNIFVLQNNPALVLCQGWLTPVALAHAHIFRTVKSIKITCPK